MIVEVKIYYCPNCGSEDIVKNGTDYKGSQKYYCHHCHGYGTLKTEARYSQEEKERVLKACQERVSMAVFDVSSAWSPEPCSLDRRIAQKIAFVEQTLDPARVDDILELDELWSYVLKKSNKQWFWIALADEPGSGRYFIGDRSEKSCRELWNRIPESYKQCHSYSDFWDAYQKVFSSETHQSVGKEAARQITLNDGTILAAAVSPFCGKTLSFSKSEVGMI